MTDKTGGLAFPKVPDEMYNGGEGLTKREWYAGQALPAIIATCTGDRNVLRNMADGYEQYCAKLAVEMADAMIAAGKETRDDTA